MASSPAQRKFHASLSLERRPRLLKDFLNDDYHHSPAASQLLIRSRSKAASATISGALHKVINIVKFFPFASAVKSPSVFISRKLSKRTPAAASGKNNLGDDNLQERPAAMVKVKDILRWRSSRDLAAEKSTPPLDDEFCYSPNRCTTATTTTGSKRSSWCDSDFTAEDLPSWCGEIDEQAVGTMKSGNNKNRFLPDETVGGYFMDDKQMDPQFDENDQHSPVSVLQSPFREDEDFSFHRSLATIESRKCMLMQRIQQLETLAGGVGGTTTRPENGADEEEGGIRGANDEAKQMMMMIHLTTEDIISCSEESYEWEVEEKREAYIRDMEKAAGMRWYNFEEEKEEVCREVEVEVFRDLVDEVLAEMFYA
nr:myb-like protein X [Ipomoea batatas]